MQTRSGSAAIRALTIAVGLGAGISAQSLVDADRIPAVREAFDTRERPPLRCEFNQVRPELTFAFRFQAGYRILVPLTQFRGPGHSLTVYARVTPDRRDPVYFSKTEELREVPATDLDTYAEAVGGFLVGEGAYAVDLLVQDEQHRGCRISWRMQAKPAGSERELAAVAPAGAVEELAAASLPRPAPATGNRIGRLSIFLHAAPRSAQAPALPPEEVDMLVDSLSSLLQQLPAQSTRLVTFNLDQGTELLRDDAFSVSKLDKVRTVLTEAKPGVLDYKTLRTRGDPAPWLINLIGADWKGPNQPDALILLGAPAQVIDDVPARDLDRPAGAPQIFLLQYQRTAFSPFSRFPGAMDRRPARVGAGLPGADGQVAYGPLSPSVAPDTIARLAARLKADTLVIRSPHDLADAVRRIDSRVPKTAPPAPPATTATAPPVRPPEETSARPTLRRVEPPPETEIADDVDPVQVLMRTRDQVLKHTQGIPNHTCVETVERRRYEPVGGRAPNSCDSILSRRGEPGFRSTLRLAGADRLRLDVALAPEREIFSWAGASKFEEGEIDELIPEGAMGTGLFAAHLVSVFRPGRQRFVFEGQTKLDGRNLLQYSFTVPREESTYRIKSRGEWTITGYTGGLMVDPRTAELVRLTVRTDELQPATGMCESQIDLDYGLVPLGGGDYLLPKIARQLFVGRAGGEGENTTTFSACREYHAESTLAFGPSSGPGDPTSAGSSGVLDLPPGLPVSIDLTAAVRIDRAAAGDRIEGRLAKPIRDEKQQKTLVPEGTVIHGRLMRVETRYAPGLDTTVVFRWETAEVRGAALPISLTPNRRLEVAKPDPRGRLRQRGVEIELPAPGETRYGMTHVAGESGVLDSGFRSEWLTAKRD